MGFERFGTVSFTGQTKSSAFVDFLDRGKLAGTRCKTCGTTFFPPRADCFRCLPGEMEWVEVAGKGRLLSFSTLIYAPTGFEADLPYTLALAEFEHEMKVFGRLSKAIPVEELRIGMDLEPAVIRLPGDRVTYEFRRTC
jgi:uncharacterized protein